MKPPFHLNESSMLPKSSQTVLPGFNPEKREKVNDTHWEINL